MPTPTKRTSTARQRTREAQAAARADQADALAEAIADSEAGSPIPKVLATIDGTEYLVDVAGFTWEELQLLRRTLAGLGYPPGADDATFVALWVTIRRDKPSLRFDAFSRRFTLQATFDAMQPATEADEAADPEA